MAVLEYIGARYVPLFAGEWDGSKSYEPLTVVSYKGSSYTSNRVVPAGIDIANADYWVVSFDYNSQIESYRAETREVSEIVQQANAKAQAAQDAADANTVRIDGVANGVQTVYNEVQQVKRETVRAYGDLDDLKADTTLINGETVHYNGGGTVADGWYEISNSGIEPNIPLENGAFANLIYGDNATRLSKSIDQRFARVETGSFGVNESSWTNKTIRMEIDTTFDTAPSIYCICTYADPEGGSGTYIVAPEAQEVSGVPYSYYFEIENVKAFTTHVDWLAIFSNSKNENDPQIIVRS